jgi:hypothetical protein
MLSNGMKPIHLTLPALVLAAGIAIGGFFISETLFKAKVALNTADVKGLAERRVQADMAYWNIGHVVAGSRKDEIPQLYKNCEANGAKIIALLKKNGLSDEEIKPGIINYVYKEYRTEEQILVSETHMLVGSIEVETSKVEMIAGIRAKLNALMAEGMDINNGEPAYHFTGLNEIKPEMLKEATKNARIAANEFAENAGVKVGGIRTAQQGGFTIRDVGSSYGDTGKIEKDVRVVTNITFFLTD